MSDDLEAINDSAHSPRPGRVLSGVVERAGTSSRAQLRVKQVERVARMVDLLSCCILGYVIVHEVNRCNRPTGKSAGGKTAVIGSSTTWSERHRNQRWKRAGARWQINVRSQPERSVIPGHNHCQYTAAAVAVRSVGSINRAVRAIWLWANLILFYRSLDL